MSTQIKLDGVWVTVAGGHRMWVGTKEARDAALAAGKLPDGTEVMTINDYTPPADTVTMGTGTLASGFTGSCTWTRKGDVVTVYLGSITGTVSGGNAALVTNLPAPLSTGPLAIASFDLAGLISMVFVDNYSSGTMGGVIRPYRGSETFNGLYGSVTYIAKAL